MASITAVILAYGDEPLLGECLEAVLASRGVELDVLLVDNGSPAVAALAPDPRLRALRPGTNTGFAGGCDLAAAQATAETLVFVNSDLIVAPDAISRLVARLDDDDVGLATGAVVLPGEPMTVNSVGNPIHFLMFSWAGAFGEAFSAHGGVQDVTGVSGAFFSCRRTHWERLGGFDATFFAYCEDADLSLRTWQAGRRVVYEPRALGVHHYAFTKDNNKWFLLERNRLILLTTLYDRRSRWLLAPLVVPVELGVLAAAWRAGWAREKIASWRWLLSNRAYLRERRRRVASAWTDAAWTGVLEGEMHIPDEFALRVPGVVNWALGRYWRLVQPLMR